MEPRNPYEAPASGWDAPADEESADADDLGPVLHTLAATLPGKPKATWTVTLHEQHARFVEDEGERRLVLRRREVPTRVTLLLWKNPILGVKAPVKFSLQMPREHVDQLKAWLGADAEQWMKALLAERRRFFVITTILVGGIGLLANDLLLIGYAAIVGVLGVLTRAAPTRPLFLADAAMGVLIAGYFCWNILMGALSVWWLAFPLVVLAAVPTNVRLFRFFGPRRS